jgi:hypothetical protein
MITALVKRVASSGMVAGAALGAVALTLAAWGSGSAWASKPSTTGGPHPSSTTTPPATASMTAKVVSDYRTMWADLVIAARTSNYQSKLLPQHATGDALSLLVQGLATDRALGIVTKGQPMLEPRVSSLTPAADSTKASITDCFDNTSWIEYKTNGTLQKNAAGGRRSTTADLVRTGGTWKVAELTIQKTGTC